MRGTDSAVELDGRSQARDRRDAPLTGAALKLQPDERLIELARGGSTGAFDAYVRRYRRAIVNYAASIVGADRAEDVAQQTFVKALEALRGEGDPSKSWLYRVAHNFSVDTLRKKANSYDQLGEQHLGPDQPQATIEGKQKFSKLISTIAKLPERERALVVGREFEGRSLDEIAAEFGSSPGAANQLLYRARKRLREACGAILPLPLLWWLLRDRSIDAVSQARVAAMITRSVKGGTVAKVAIAGLGFGAAAVGIGAIGVGAIDDGRAKPRVEVAQSSAPELDTTTDGNARNKPGDPTTAAPAAGVPSWSRSDASPGARSGTLAIPHGDSRGPQHVSDPDEGSSEQIFTPGSGDAAPPNGGGGSNPSSGGGSISSGGGSTGGGGPTGGGSPGGGGGSTGGGGGGGSIGGGTTPPSWLSPTSVGFTNGQPGYGVNGSGVAALSWVDWSDQSVRVRRVTSSRSRASLTDDQTISLPGQNAANSSPPSVSVAADGRIAVAWMSWDTDPNKSDIEVAVSDSDGQFASPQRVSQRRPSDHPQLGYDGAGNLIVVWLSGAAGQGRVEAAIRSVGSSAFGAQVRLSKGKDADYAKLAVGDDGTAAVIWKEESKIGTAIEVAVKTPAGGFGQPEQLADMAHGLVEERHLHVHVDEDGNTRAVWGWADAGSSGTEASGGLFTAYRPKAGVFGFVATLAATEPSDFRIVTARNGTGVVVWTEQLGSRSSTRAAMLDASGLGAPVTVSDVGERAATPDVVIDSHGRATVVWISASTLRTRFAQQTADGTFNAAQDVPGTNESSSPILSIDSSDKIYLGYTQQAREFMFTTFE